jgi:probable phosphoglycerate mutase
VTRLIIWRHGQTAWNAASRVQGQIDIELSEVGRVQAAEAAARLAAIGPTRIASSDLRRAAVTAEALATLTGLEVSYDIRLRERHYGPWQGLTPAEIAARWPEENTRWLAGESALGLGIETLDELAKRSAAACTDAVGASRVDPTVFDAEGVGGDVGEERGEVVVVATHGGTARIAVAATLGWPEHVVRTLGGLGNCRWTELRFDPVRGWQLRAHNVG